MRKKPANNDPEVIESYQLSHLLRQTSDAIHKCREYELKKYNISPEQAGALVCIYSLGSKATPIELSRALFRERNSITILLNRMHKLGLIEKKADLQKKNLIRLSLTEKGYEAYKHAIEFQSFIPLVEILPIQKRKQLWRLLQTVRLKLLKDLNLDADSYSVCIDQPLNVERVNSDGEGNQ